jgi:superoxide reductase
MTMLNPGEIYKCEACGAIVEVLHAGTCVMTCCEAPMVLQAENTVEASREKHIPVVETIPGGVRVKVGSVEHPMIETHYIEWIEVRTADKVHRKNLVPGEKPVAEFKLDEEILSARAYCNLHLLWKS